ncbi:ABC transporter [Nocardioides zeae]|uniref:ABC transporter n=1 Tax=Nocardioides imazamoxiresistens TaxID=3231893 RepID=A0ABU3Q0T9_9ACTN|nr:ABC transporter [Nocardioides zeae]MDT9594979.1 ABC transporter [Nocardioides zeae]
MRSRIPSLAVVSVLALTLAACSSEPEEAQDAAASDASDTGGDGHGAVAGAAEVSEPQLGLTTIAPSGAVSHLDLLDESVTDLGEIGAPTAMTTDGRYLFAQTDAGVEIVDSGRWTWDHVDHFHYYRADPQLLGAVEGGGTATVATTNLSTTGGTGLFFPESGEAVLLDTEQLSKGEIDERFRLDVGAHAGLVVPVGSFALVTTGDGEVDAYTSDGEPTGLTEACVDPAGTITTRVGAVLGCADGALLAHVQDEELVVERVPYPDGTTAPAASDLDNREGRPTVAALAGEEGIWLLDTRERSWTLLPAPEPLVSVTAVDDAEQHLLALTADGRVLVMDGEDGAVLAETDPLVATSVAGGRAPALLADQQRAYLSGPVERRLFEIDFADGARVARTFETFDEPAFTAETGR